MLKVKVLLARLVLTNTVANTVTNQPTKPIIRLLWSRKNVRLMLMIYDNHSSQKDTKKRFRENEKGSEENLVSGRVSMR